MSLEIEPGRGGLPGLHTCADAPQRHLPFNSRFLNQKQSAPRAAVFLDRDGVLVRDVHYLRQPSQIDVLPNVQVLRFLQHRFSLVVATNQSGIARELFTEEMLLNIHAGIVHRLADIGVILDAFYYCPHLPTASNERYRMECNCRKPKPGMLIRAAAEWGITLKNSYMIGDSERDIEAGRAAGLGKSILLRRSSDATGIYAREHELERAVETILGVRPEF